MNTYARIHNGLVAEIFATSKPISGLFHPSITWVDITNVVSPPSEGWTAVESAGSWSFAAPVPMTPSLASQALQALRDSDVVILRCYEKAVAVPSAWASYRSTLRTIVDGSNAGPVPTAPAYPAAT